MGIRCANHVTPLYPQKLALTSPTGGGRSVGMVRSRTKATGKKKIRTLNTVHLFHLSILVVLHSIQAYWTTPQLCTSLKSHCSINLVLAFTTIHKYPFPCPHSCFSPVFQTNSILMLPPHCMVSQPVRPPSQMCVQPKSNSLPYFLTCCTLITQSPYISNNCQQILMEETYFTHKNWRTLLAASQDQLSYIATDTNKLLNQTASCWLTTVDSCCM